MPKVVNVYEEWTPVNHGDPLRDDATLYYAPPSLERVRITSRYGQTTCTHVQSGAARHSQGFEDKNLGGSPDEWAATVATYACMRSRSASVKLAAIKIRWRKMENRPEAIFA